MGPAPDESPLAGNKDILTCIVLFEPASGAGGASEQDGRDGIVTQREVLRRRLTGARLAVLEDLQRRVAYEAAIEQHMLQTTNNVAALPRSDVPNVGSTGRPTMEVAFVRVAWESDPATPATTAALRMLAGVSEKLIVTSSELQTVSDDLALETRMMEWLRDSVAAAATARQPGDDDESLQGPDESGVAGCGGGSGGGGLWSEPTGPEP